MDFLTFILAPERLIFTIPVLFSLTVWLMALIGLFDFHIFDFDAGAHDAHLHLPDGFLQLLGLGHIPLSMIITLVAFIFGWTGLFISKMLVYSSGGLSLALISLASLAVSLGITGLVARPLKPFFKDYGTPAKADDIIGKMAILKTNSITPDFGTVTVKLDGGIIVELSARTTVAANSLKSGDNVLVVDYDPQKNIYIVEPVK